MSLLSMVAGLIEAKIEFVVIGGFAAAAHGSSRITEDLDICYHPTPENIRRLAALLARWGAYLRGVEAGLPWVMDERTFRTTPVMTLITDRGAIDVMDQVLGVGDYAQVLANSVRLASAGLEFRGLDLPALLRSKRAAKRPKDLEQIPELEALLAMRRRRR